MKKKTKRLLGRVVVSTVLALALTGCPWETERNTRPKKADPKHLCTDPGLGTSPNC